MPQNWENSWVGEHVEVLGNWSAQRELGSPVPHIIPYTMHLFQLAVSEV